MISVMLAHCVTLPVPIIKLKDYGLMPQAEDWNLIAYMWQDEYLAMAQRDFIAAGMWDRQCGACCVLTRLLLACLLAGWLAGWLACWLAGLWACWLAGLLACWLAGLLAC